MFQNYPNYLLVFLISEVVNSEHLVLKLMFSVSEISEGYVTDCLSQLYL